MTHLLEIYFTNCFIQQPALPRVVKKKETVKIIPRIPNTDFLIDQYKCKYFVTFFMQAQVILVNMTHLPEIENGQCLKQLPMFAMLAKQAVQTL